MMLSLYILVAMSAFTAGFVLSSVLSSGSRQDEIIELINQCQNLEKKINETKK